MINREDILQARAELLQQLETADELKRQLRRRPKAASLNQRLDRLEAKMRALRCLLELVLLESRVSSN